MASNVQLYNAGNDKNDTEAKKEAQELKQALDKERALLGQMGAKVPAGTQAATVPSTALAAGAAAAGSYSNLKDSPSVGPGKNFTSAQKRNILEQNMANNGGVLRSDA
jgi:hypothetical protein